ncbi:MAG: tandem-95 repeat protein, partial [Verrucomicrobia bacterium]
LNVGSFAARVDLALPVGTNGGNPYRLRAVDLDGDGKLDLIVCEVYGSRVSLFHNISSPGNLTTNSFEAPVSLPAGSDCRFATAADLDGDGRVDIVALNYGGNSISLFRNIGAPGSLTANSFAAPVNLPAPGGPYEVAIGDLDGDGRPELAVANADVSVTSIFRNQTTIGTLDTNSFAAHADISSLYYGHTIAIGDLDGDGKPDLTVGFAIPGYISVFRNLGIAGAFTTNSLAAPVNFVLPGRGHTVALGDIDGDSKTDIVVVGEVPSFLSIFKNVSTAGAFDSSSLAPNVDFGTGWNAWGVAVGDLDGDTRPDIVFCNAYDANITIYPNAIPLGSPTPGTNCVTPPGGLVSWWRAETTNALDAVGGNHGTLLNGTSFTAGMVGAAFNFDGSNQCVQIPYSPSLIAANYSVEAWVRPASQVDDPAGQDLIFGQSYGDYQLVVRTGTTGLRVIWQFGTSHSTFYEVASTNEIPIGQFSHLAGTWDGTILRLYINGVLNAQSTPGVVPVDSGCPFFIGGFYSPAADSCQYVGQFINGNIDETSFFNRALSSAEVLAIYNAGSAGKCVISNPPPVLPPVITTQPTNLTVYVSSNATFTVAASGTAPLRYQWFFSSSPLTGQTSSTLALRSVQLSNAGSYFVVVTNAGGARTSAGAVLTVNALPSCTPPPAGLISWWRGETNANDNWDSNNGTTPRQMVYNAGKVGQAFNFSERYVLVTDAPSLRPTNALTIEAWVNPTTITFPNLPARLQTILSKFDYEGAGIGGTATLGSSYYLGLTNGNRVVFKISATGSPATNATLISLLSLPTNQWSHVAATFGSGTLRIYINGVQDLKLAGPTNIFAGNANLSIGALVAPEILLRTGYAFPFTGLIDEVSIYYRELAQGELQNIVSADFIGKCQAAPQVLSQPVSQSIPMGEDVKFSVSAVGTQPLRYQWRLNGLNIINATNSFFVAEKVQGKTGVFGNFSVVITNALGTVTSSNAALTLLPAPSCAATPAGLISWWPADSNLADAMATNNVSSFSPSLYATGKVGQAFSFNGISSRITVPNSGSLNFGSTADGRNTEFSIEMWIKAGASNTTYANVPFFEKWDSGIGYSLALNQGRLAFALGTSPASATNVSRFVSAGPDLRDTMFHHVAVSLNRTNASGGSLYVDGQLVLTFDPTPRKGSLTAGTPLYLGAPSITTSNSYFGGLIDEPAIYNRALSAAEILAIRNAGAAGRCKMTPTILAQPLSQRVTVGSNVTFSVTAGGSPKLRYQWLSNNVAISGATNESLTFTAINVSGANYSVRVTNLFGSVLSASAVLTVNFAPLALDLNLKLDEDTGVTFGLPAADANLDPLTYLVLTQPQHGVLGPMTNSPFPATLTYTPSPNYNGPDSFTFKVNDGMADSAPAAVNFTVLPVNDAPVAYDATVTLDEDTTATVITAANDVDGDDLVFTVVTPPAHGVFNSSGYTPDTNYFGPDSFTFQVGDGKTNSNIATVSITVLPVNDVPFARISVSPLADFPGVTNQVILAAVCTNAVVVLDFDPSS